MIELVLGLGAPIDFVDPVGTLLSKCVHYGDLACVQTLLTHGASTTVVPTLPEASLGGKVEIARLLLEHGAPVDQLDKDGWPAVCYVGCNAEMAKLLVEHGADPDVPCKYGKTAREGAPCAFGGNP